MYRVSEAKQKLYEERQNYINIDSFPNDLTIISNTCIGGRLYHDYHQKFLTPTIDCYMEPKSFVKFCINLKYYLEFTPEPLPDYKIDYLSSFLFCKIGDLIVAFGHTNDSYDTIIKKWEERKKRVNYDNIIVICTDRNVYNKPFTRCDDETVEKFGKIPYKKVLFTTKQYDYDYTSYLKSFKDDDGCPEATRPSNKKQFKYILEEDGFDLDKFITEK